METYNHFTYGESLAKQLIPISHTLAKPRHFTAFGLEALYNLDDKLSSVTGMILISVDGYESDSKDNGADQLTDKRIYSFIVAKNTTSDNPKTLNTAVEDCRSVAKQIRNKMLLNSPISDIIDRDTQINGIGPIGDNFYGVVLTLTVNEPEIFSVDDTYWQEV